MIPKADIVRENRKLTSNLKIAQKTVATLTKENRALRVPSKTNDRLRFQIEDRDLKTKVLQERLASFENDHKNYAAEVVASHNLVRGRAKFLSMPWYVRMFMSRITIRKVLLNDKL